MPAPSSALLGEEDPRATQVWATQVWAAMQRTTRYLAENQAPDGHWCGELVGDTILESETILLYAFLGGDLLEFGGQPWVQQATAYILEHQRSDGSWGQFAGSPIDVSASVKAYLALKIAGYDADSPPMQRARQAIMDPGGADQVNSFTRFYLALLGQISYDCCPAVPPEMVLLPSWSPINIYRFSAWSRTIFVPLSLVWAHRPCRQLPANMSIDELFHKPPKQWPALQNPGSGNPGSGNPGSGNRLRDRAVAACFRGVDRCLKMAERLRLRPWRRRALRAAESWMMERFQHSDGLGAIYPPIVWSLVALRCLGYDDSSPEVIDAHRQLKRLQVPQKNSDGVPTLHWQPCMSPVWDTAISLRALAANPSTSPDVICRASRWLLDREIQRPGDWSQRVSGEPAGWCFEYENAFYPDIDDTIMVMMALQEASERLNIPESRVPESHVAAAIPTAAIPTAAIPAACERGRRWVLAMQNRDGGWGAFDRDNDAAWLCHVPFADHNAMIDPSTPDITARVVEALAITGMDVGDPPIQKAIQYLRKTQDADGSWFGRWGVNHIYGTWQVLVGLRAIGIDADDQAIQRGADWLEQHQHSSGGWGESANSYLDDSSRGRGQPTPSQTSWALLGLCAAGRHRSHAVICGLEFLEKLQRNDGRWEEAEFTGTGFPRVFYLRYDYYSVYFPLLALAVWHQACIDELQVDDPAQAA